MSHGTATFRASMELEPTRDSIPVAADFIEEQLDALGAPIKVKTKLMVIVDDAYSNIAFYSEASWAELVVQRVEFDAEDDAAGDAAADAEINVIFRDNGIPFDPLAIEEPDITASVEDRNPGGLGILMMKRMMDDVAYERVDECNILTLTMRVPA